MRLHNSLNNKIEEFETSGDEITFYSCGPTVYDNAHIGNLASFIYADTLRRVLEVNFPDKKVRHVMNITDVDDKTIARALQMHPDLAPKDALKKLTSEITEKFIDDLRLVGVEVDAIEFIKATDHIQQIQDLIKNLLKSGVAYLADDGIYFSICKYKEFGKKYGQLVEIDPDSIQESRIDNDEYDKDSVQDFALWKKAKDNEPSWDFKIAKKNMSGRPGWHIECSAMSTHYLGQPFDIHSGGVDLKFPHHENEIAQSTAGADSDYLARFFVHSEHVLVESSKMAKSANNFYTVEDIIQKGFDPLAFRLLVLQGHYQSRLNFSWDNLKAAQQRLESLRHLVEVGFQVSQTSFDSTEILALISDNLHTPKMLAELDVSANQINDAKELLDALLGLGLCQIEDAAPKIYTMMEERQMAKDTGDYSGADKIRKDIEELGYQLNDGPEGTIWQRA